MKATTVRAALPCANIYCALQGGRSEISCCDHSNQKATEHEVLYSGTIHNA